MDALIEYSPSLLAGAWVTLKVALMSVLLALALTNCHLEFLGLPPFRCAADGVQVTLDDGQRLPVGTHLWIRNDGLLVTQRLEIVAQLDKDTTDLVLDVKTVQIAGKLLLNGVLPMLDAYCTANPTTFTATLRFTELQSGVITTLKTLCKDATFSFAASIYPGTYRITVDGTNTYSNIPTGAFVAISRITLP